MKHEKIIKRDDGSQVKIYVRFFSDHINEEFRYSVNIFVKPPNQQNWDNVEKKLYDLKYRELSKPKRKVARNQRLLNFATAEEIHAVKIELWEKMKPVSEN
jgi:hypothetical protein